MGSRVFETVLNRKIENFAATFIDDSTSIFFDSKKLIHPGEYGKYRENSLKELIRQITKHKISDGFIITPDDKISSQIDVVIYKNDEAPILENNYMDFFSIESTIGIGEVKSTLDKSTFIEALLKLAKNKQLHESKKGTLAKKNLKNDEHDDLISFLVCKNTSFNVQAINFDEIYEQVDNKYRHNFILIIENGLIGYEFGFSEFNAFDKDLFIQNGGNINAIVWYEYPFYSFNDTKYITKPIFHEIKLDNKYYHIKLFLTKLAQSIEYKNLYNTEFAHYINLPISPIFKE